MIENDTIRLLRECDAGTRMGISSIEDVIGHVSAHRLKDTLEKARSDHKALESSIQRLLGQYHDEGKEPGVMAKGMSWMKTNVKLAADSSDETIADLMTDGCNMGIKSLSRYLNQYKAADEKSKDIAKRLITLEDKLCADVRAYL